MSQPVAGLSILVVDNYDSFVYNLVHYAGQLGAAATVVRNDDRELTTALATGASEGELTALAEVLRRYDGVLVSPGPGVPSDAGASPAIIRACREHALPLLGVCLGHQGLGECFGATVQRADEVLHGKVSEVLHDGTGVMAGLPNPVRVTRYHSLTVVEETLPDELMVTGRTASGMIMSMRHRDLPLHSVQFHPESVMTDAGHRIMANWLAVCAKRSAKPGPDDEVIAHLEAEMRETVGKLTAEA